MLDVHSRKRPFPMPPPQEDRPRKDRRRDPQQMSPRHNPRESAEMAGDDMEPRNKHQMFAREQTRLNQIQEAEQMREWVSKEDEFVLKQSKKKARIRVREGRATTIDWLAVTLAVIDATHDPLEDDEDELDIEVIDPSGVFEGLSLSHLHDLAKDIDTYLLLEKSSKNRRYWSALKIICQDYQNKLALPTTTSGGRSTSSVSADIERLLGPKNLPELEGLEEQIRKKLRSNDPIDVEYWEHLLQSVGVYKSRAELDVVYRSVVQSRLDDLRKEEEEEATDMQHKLQIFFQGMESQHKKSSNTTSGDQDGPPQISYTRDIDPEPMLRLRQEDKGYDLLNEDEFLAKTVRSRP